MAGDSATGGDGLGTAADVTIAMCGQDRVARHPASWAEQIEAAIVAAAGTPAPWTAFKDAVTAALVPAGEPPVVLLDHTGAPRTSGDVRLRAGADDLTLSLAAGDAGDLQRTVERRHAADPAAVPRAAVFQGAASVQVNMLPAGDHQLALLEDGTTGAEQLTVPNSGGHVTATELTTWFAPQFAVPSGGAPALAQYTRGNKVQPLVNGPEFFDDLFRVLHGARNANGGFHLAGWAMFPDQDFTTKRADDPADLARTLHAAAQAIGDAGGSTRFLPAQFFNLQPAETVTGVEIFAFSVLMIGLLAARNVDAVRSDAAGAVVLLGLMIANAILINVMLETSGRPLEPNKDAIDVLDPLPNAAAHYAPFPATVDDNPMAPTTSGFPFDTLFTVDRHFGVYHQKLSIVRRAAGDVVGYCGGIDLNPDRLDDVRHLLKAPFHDVHARVEGPAVARPRAHLRAALGARRRRRGAGLRDADGGIAGHARRRSVVQVARTYFKAADPARAFAFAPLGDRTSNDTILQAIAAATEFIYIEDQYFTPPASYRAALTAKVASGDISSSSSRCRASPTSRSARSSRSGLIDDLRVADAGRGIVRIGYPRRHYTLPDNDLRASSGRCLLTEDLAAGGGTTSTVCLGPAARLPPPPFWLAIEGELMYVNDEAIAALMPAPAGSTRFAVVRGDSTRLIKGGAAPKGSTPRAHTTGAAATVVDLANIYVHAKMMIVDDVFLSVGSANLNRRGLFHDGEINAFTVPERLKGDPANPVRDLRLRLWAEMLDLPAALAAPLLADPVAATALFDRSPLTGNRYTDALAYPEHVMFGENGGDGIVSTVLQLAGVVLLRLRPRQALRRRRRPDQRPGDALMAVPVRCSTCSATSRARGRRRRCATTSATTSARRRVRRRGWPR